jgi:hypothetical protein
MSASDVIETRRRKANECKYHKPNTNEVNKFPRASFYISNLPNTIGLPIQPAISFKNLSDLNYWDGVQFMISANITVYSSSLNEKSSETTITNLSLHSFILTIYPKALVDCPNDIFYLDNGVEIAGTQVSYAPISNNYAPHGRPFYVSNVVNEGNVVNALPVSFTSSSVDKKFVFSFPAINYQYSSATSSYSVNLQLLNIGNMKRQDISVVGFSESQF